jgi:hypothetical protein
VEGKDTKEMMVASTYLTHILDIIGFEDGIFLA